MDMEALSTNWGELDHAYENAGDEDAAPDSKINDDFALLRVVIVRPAITKVAKDNHEENDERSNE